MSEKRIVNCKKSIMLFYVFSSRNLIFFLFFVQKKESEADKVP